LNSDLKEKKERNSELEKKLQKIEKDNETVKERLESSKEMEQMLSARAAELENQLLEYKFKINQFEITCNAQV
jgi:septal ring factor EnvC (AmiA/AmiB activator)